MVPMNRRMLRRAVTAVGLAAAMVGPAPASATTLFTLTGHGYGHGIGMSQWGAYGYATHGWDYQRILAHYFTGTQVAAVPTGVVERVLLTSGPTLDIRSASSITVRNEATATSTPLPAGSYQIALSAGRVRVVNRSTGGTVLSGLAGPVDVTPGSGQQLQLDNAAGSGFAGDHWPGWFRIVISGSSLLCIDQVLMERYLQGVVPNEVPAGWPTPALRAQAVAARSYAYATRNPSGLFDAYADTRSQVFGPSETLQATTSDAVVATTSSVVWYHGTIATTFFSSSSGGRTSSEQASWGSTAGQPYLISVGDPYDWAGGLNLNHTWAPRVFTTTGLATLFGFAGGVGGVEQTWDGPSQRELTLTLHTGAGDHVYTGWGAESRLGLRSNYFRIKQVTITPAATSVTAGVRFTFSGRVWPLPELPVGLHKQTGTSTTWTVAIPTVKLDSEGRFSYTFQLYQSHTYRLRLANGATSPTVRIAVHPARPLDLLPVG
jgi:stage II sporulation protein D